MDFEFVSNSISKHFAHPEMEMEMEEAHMYRAVSFFFRGKKLFLVLFRNPGPQRLMRSCLGAFFRNGRPGPGKLIDFEYY